MDVKAGRPTNNSPRAGNLDVPSQTASRYRKIERYWDDVVCCWVWISGKESGRTWNLYHAWYKWKTSQSQRTDLDCSTRGTVDIPKPTASS